MHNAKRIKGERLVLIIDTTVPVGAKNIDRFIF